MISKKLLLLSIILLALQAASQNLSLTSAEDTSPHKSAFITINGVKLNYLDWGGKGETILFISGMGDTAHVFDEMAPKFTDRFRVVALTRRGYGESDKPEAGYDVKTLADDVREFLDVMKIKRADLIGHSIGGDELTQFAASYPRRVHKLVYLDAAYDRREVPEILKKDPLATGENPSRITAALMKGAVEFRPDYAKLTAPVRNFYAIFEHHWALKPDTDESTRSKAQEFIETLARPYQMRNIELFRREAPKGKVVILRNTTHYFFKDPAIKDDIVRQTRYFLLSK